MQARDLWGLRCSCPAFGIYFLTSHSSLSCLPWGCWLRSPQVFPKQPSYRGN